MPHPRANGIPPKNSPRAERYEAGRALRKRVARETHADCPPASGRDPVAILALTDGARIPELLPIRYERMLRSPFTFLRGAAAVMAHDLSASSSNRRPCAGLRRLPFAELRSFQLAGRTRPFRHQRFRRDLTRHRFHGGPETARRQRGGCRSRREHAGQKGARSCQGHRAILSRIHPRTRHEDAARSLVHAHGPRPRGQADRRR